AARRRSPRSASWTTSVRPATEGGGLRWFSSLSTALRFRNRVVEILSEPAGDLVQTLNAATRLSAAGEAMALLGEAHKTRGDAAIAQSDEDLLALFHGAAMILLAVDDQGRRHHVFQVRD